MSSLGAGFGAFGSVTAVFCMRIAVTEISNVVPAVAPMALAASDDS